MRRDSSSVSEPSDFAKAANGLRAASAALPGLTRRLARRSHLDADTALVVSAIVQATAAVATVILIGLTIRLNRKANRFIEQQARTDLEALYLESVPILEAGLMVGGSFGGSLRWRLLRSLVAEADTVSFYVRWRNVGKSAAAKVPCSAGR